MSGTVSMQGVSFLIATSQLRKNSCEVEASLPMSTVTSSFMLAQYFALIKLNLKL